MSPTDGSLSNWAKQTDNLPPWQRKLAYDIGVRMARGRPPSAKQALYGSRILDEADRLGFELHQGGSSTDEGAA